MLRSIEGYQDLVDQVLPRVAGDTFYLGLGIKGRNLLEVVVEDVEVVWNGNIPSESGGEIAEVYRLPLKGMSDSFVIATFKEIQARGMNDFLRFKFELK